MGHGGHRHRALPDGEVGDGPSGGVPGVRGSGGGGGGGGGDVNPGVAG